MDAMTIMAGSLSLDEPTTEEGDLMLRDRMQQTEIPSPEEHANVWNLRRDVDRCLQHLPLIEQKVVRWRFGMNDEHPKTLREIGERLNLSRETIRQIECGALQKLQRIESSQFLSSYLA